MEVLDFDVLRMLGGGAGPRDVNVRLIFYLAEDSFVVSLSEVFKQLLYPLFVRHYVADCDEFCFAGAVDYNAYLA